MNDPIMDGKFDLNKPEDCPRALKDQIMWEAEISRHMLSAQRRHLARRHLPRKRYPNTRDLNMFAAFFTGMIVFSAILLIVSAR